MKRSTLLTLTAAGLLFGTATAFAQTDSPGASGYAPGKQDRSGTTGPGASDFAPGQRAKTEGGVAKDYAPGQRMKNETTGSASLKASTKAKGKQKK
ncbi:MAG TPA: hypothetical protein VFK79_18020 [Xanthobacteraceae bacterium]|nr:hypothetical protein [Xanthobacteraceae bacterium]